MTSRPSNPSAAELVFAEYLERIEAGEACDFDAFCVEHEGLRPALQRMHAQWAAMHLAFERIGDESTEALPVDEAVGGMDALLGRMGRGRLTRYELGDEIARGGMGRIVRAFDNELRREVALKLQRGDARDARRRRRFLEEAQIAAQLDHPCIAPVHELGLDAEGRPFFSMQLVRGRDLADIFRASGEGDQEWSRARVLGVLLRVCEAMAFAHERGVVHRDLKPQNIMVGRFGETFVMDWGLAHVQGAVVDSACEGDAPLDTVRRDLESSGSSSDLLTRDGDVVGTPAYMAPEQADGSAEVAASVDVYAVGAMLYHLLTGRPPYGQVRERSGSETLARLRMGPPSPLSDSVPAELRAICERAMARLPVHRYASMVELADDLRAFLEVRTVRAYATGRFAELRKWVARNRTLTIAAMSFVAALALLAAGITMLWLEAEGNRREADGVSSQLRAELERRSFRSARQSLQLENSREAGDALWRTHLLGAMPRASAWALQELARRDPYLATLPLADDLRPVAFCRQLGAVLLGGLDGRLQVRDEVTLGLRAEIGQLGASIMSLQVLPGSNLAICGTSDGVVRTVDLDSASTVHEITAHRGSVRYIVTGQGGAFATGGADGVVLWWPSATGEPRRLLKLQHGVTSLTMRSALDGLAAGDERGNIRAVALHDSWQVRYGIGGRVTGLAFGAHDNELWVGGTDHQLHRFDFVDSSRNSHQPTRNGTCRQLVRDQDGSLLAGGWWRVDRIPTNGAAVLPAALRGISRWALDAERRRLVTSGAVCGLGLLDLSQQDRRHVPGSISVALSGDGERYATVEAGAVVVKEVATDAELRRLPAGTVGHLHLDQHGQLLTVTSGQPLRVAVYAVESGERLQSLAGPDDDPFGACVAFAPTGVEAAVVIGGNRIVRQSRRGEPLGELVFDGTAIGICYSASGEHLAAIGRDGNVARLFDLKAGGFEDHAFVAMLPNDRKATLSALALSSDMQRIAVGTWQGAVLVRNLKDRNAPTTTIAAHAGTIWSVAFDPQDPGLLITSGGSQGIACWDLDSNECCYQDVDDVATSVRISDDGRTMACVVPDGVLLLDLSYRRRHIAGTLDYHVSRLVGDVAIPPSRELELRTWAATVMAEAWPRWR